MGLLLPFVIGVIFTWVVLIIVIPIARKLSDFSVPPWPETMAKLAVIAVAVNFIQVFLGLVNGIAAIVVSAVVFFMLLYKWFDIDLWAAIVIVLISWLVRAFLIAALLGLLLSVLGSS